MQQVGARFSLPVRDATRLATAVAALSKTYTRERDHLAQGPLQGDAELARLGFFLARDAIKVFGPLRELHAAGLFAGKKQLRVLDLGAGLGSTTFGTARFLQHVNSGVEKLTVTAIERDASSTKLMRALHGALAELRDELVAFDLDVHAGDLRQVSERGPFDLVLLGFALNELFLELPPQEQTDARAKLLHDLWQRLSPTGALVVLEPALKESTRQLMRVRDALLQSAPQTHVFAPCVHRNRCPMLLGERDWCHETLDYALPKPLADVARAAGLRYEGLSYAALVLTRAPRAFAAGEGALYRIVSDRLHTKGKLELFGCGESGYQRLTRLERDESGENRAFGEARRGDVLRVPEARVGKLSKIEKV